MSEQRLREALKAILEDIRTQEDGIRFKTMQKAFAALAEPIAAPADVDTMKCAACGKDRQRSESGEWIDVWLTEFNCGCTLAAPTDEARDDVYPCVRIRVDEAGKVIEASLYAPGLPAGEFNIYPVGIENCATGRAAMATPAP